MKFEKHHMKQLSDELETKYMDRKFPDEIAEMLEGVKQDKMLSIINYKDDPAVEGSVLESIILAFNRPSFLIRQNTFDPSPSETWEKLLSPYMDILNGTISSVGRIEMKNHSSLDWAGTGFLVEENIIVTNRHVAEHFAQTKSQGYDWKTNARGKIVKARIDFREEYQNPVEQEMELVDILHIEPEPGPDLALFSVNLEDYIKPLELSSSPSTDDIIVTIGYPWKDTRVSFRIEQVMSRIFGDIFDVKRLAPGKIISLEGKIIHHDCTTLGGNSGSAILDVETGKVVALHYSGDVKYNNAVSVKVIADRMRKIKKT